ncbi:MAG: hypothetical protein ACE5IR_17220 [bacterium]
MKRNAKIHPNLNMLSQFLIAIGFAVLIAGCGSSNPYLNYRPLPDDHRPIPEPKKQKINIPKDGFDKTISDQIEQTFDFSRQLRNISGNRKRALNADPFGEVANSSWFTNRNAKRTLTLDEIAKGPNQGAEPTPTGTWTIFKAKVEGVTPGFHVEDGKGIKWVIKLDPQDYPELGSGAEVVSTKLFYAAGYNVPENYIVKFDPEILRIGRNVTIEDHKGRKRQMTGDDLQQLLSKVQKQPDGRFRAIASKYLQGKLLGPFMYKGTRKDDPNDIIPHQHHRELRGLRVFAAWLNHFDTKANNTLDVYLEDGQFIRHCLIDFGSTLGSNGDEPMSAQIGHENGFDPHQFAANIFTLGFHVKGWEKSGEIQYPSIGYFESELFRSEKYKFLIPNPAFELMADEDAFWGAKLVMSFTNEQLQTAVDQGEYSDPEAAAYLLQVLKERRDKTGRYWFNKMTPLDNFRIREASNGKTELHFTDLAIESSLESAANTTYRYRIKVDDSIVVNTTGFGGKTSLELPLPENNRMTNGSTDEARTGEISIQAKRGPHGKWIRLVKIYVSLTSEGSGYTLLGVRRE